VIDRPSRNKLAEALRALASGQISNDEFERRVPIASADPAVWHIFFDGVWGLYSDLSEYHLKGRQRLKPEAKAAVARCVLFLKTDQSFAWPQPSGLERLGTFFANLLTLGIAARFFQRRYRAAGEFSVWPFISRTSYEQALRSPVYLHRAL
jgi:hypothetical protein